MGVKVENVRGLSAVPGIYEGYVSVWHGLRNGSFGHERCGSVKRGFQAGVKTV